ncbi:hypothetical protein DJ568_05840 [Mucilaginibacter hurinus]|uniref:Uncharacterized protein n=1 Tax=Mucilaginibacter hurinus TaxID=2201324 RepID=A0A367GRR1_9SPHI|nr:hypothetical protein [Mucilaginibacter hurinus]RCH55413.1 hypothetical protein DJ568_05840 [Mucilaginibacter hurinus]
MKKFILIVLSVSAAAHANAQQPLKYSRSAPRLVDDKAWPQLWVKDSLFKTKPEKSAGPWLFKKKREDALAFYSNMPVAQPSKSRNSMPVADLSGDFKHSMPVVKIDNIKPGTLAIEKLDLD